MKKENIFDTICRIALVLLLIIGFTLIGFLYYKIQDPFGDKRTMKVLTSPEYGMIVESGAVRTYLIEKFDLPWVDFRLTEGKFLKYYFKRDEIIDKELLPISEAREMINKFIEEIKLNRNVVEDYKTFHNFVQ